MVVAVLLLPGSPTTQYPEPILGPASQNLVLLRVLASKGPSSIMAVGLGSTENSEFFLVLSLGCCAAWMIVVALCVLVPHLLKVC